MKYELIDNTYRRIVDFRNQITHGYFGIDEEIVWDVITKKLQVFYDDLITAVKTKRLDLTKAIEAAMIENNHNNKIIAFLDSLKKEIF